MSVNIDSTRYGHLEIAEEKVILFPRGIAGFENCKRYALLHPESEEPKYFILQSLDDAAVAFNITDPATFGFSYEISIDESIAVLLEQPDTPEAVADNIVLVILSKDGDEAPLRANLKAPLIFNLKTRRGVQHVFTRLDYTV